MKTKRVNAIKRLAIDLAERALLLKLFLPSRRDASCDVPCLTDAVAGLRRQVGRIEEELALEFPRKPGEDILWRSFEFEVPPDEHPVLVSLYGHPEAIPARWIDARWHYLNGVQLWGEVYAWSPLPAACHIQRKRLLLLAGTERRAS
ncbi:MAG: hypothetical protein HZC55_04215 [Verrucomicrobia bacterium]|nr:hypothetical protein [Verrucomicrobiota bacterium]